MEELNKRYRIKLEVMTPLAIGAGAENDWTKGFDYIQEKGLIYVINLSSLDGFQLDCIVNRDNGWQEIFKKHAKYVFKAPSAESSSAIKSFIRTQLKQIPYIPGSSLKGAIRSILFKHIKTENNVTNFRDKKKCDEEILGKITGNFMHFISVSDFHLGQYSTEIVNTNIFNLQQQQGRWVGGWKTSSSLKPAEMNMLYECARVGQKALGNISLLPRMFKNLRLNSDIKISYNDTKSSILAQDDNLTSLFSIINSHTLQYLQKERAFFEKFSVSQKAKIIECIDALIKELEEANNQYCILKMSAGSGFHSITGDYQFDDYTNGTLNRKPQYPGEDITDHLPKSRKIVTETNRIQLMGFVKLSVTDEETLSEEAQVDFVQQQSEIASYISEIEILYNEGNLEEAILKVDAVLKLDSFNENAKNWKMSIEKKAKENAENEKLWLEAEELFNSKKFDEAKAKYYELKNKQNYKVKECSSRIEEILSMPTEPIVPTNSVSGVPLATALSNITSAGQLAGNLKKWAQVNEFAENELNETITLLKAQNKVKPKDIKSKRKDFVKALGEEFTNKLLEKLDN